MATSFEKFNQKRLAWHERYWDAQDTTIAEQEKTEYFLHGRDTLDIEYQELLGKFECPVLADDEE